MSYSGAGCPATVHMGTLRWARIADEPPFSVAHPRFIGQWAVRDVTPNHTRRLLLRRVLLVASGVYILPLGRFAAAKLGPFELVVKHQ